MFDYLADLADFECKRLQSATKQSWLQKILADFEGRKEYEI